MAKTLMRRPKNKKKDGSWSEIREGMRIDWDVPITMDDGLILRANVYRPTKKGKYPVLVRASQRLSTCNAGTCIVL